MTFPLISASLMAADPSCLGDEIRAMTHAGIDAFHWDIMDGHFVPNLTFGPAIVEKLRPASPAYFDVHLMVTNPEHWIDTFAKAGADAITFHAELPHDFATLVKHVKSHDIDVGIAFNPETPLEHIDTALLAQIDRILIMSVKPGFGGQAYIDQSEKIQRAAALRDHHTHLRIIVDGGVNNTTAPNIRAAGATDLISGSYLFEQRNNYDTAIASLRGNGDAA